MIEEITMDWVLTKEFILRALLALLSGLLIGLEREFKGKSAGLKTNALVALGAAIFVTASLKFAGEDYVDMTRVLGQVVAGIGFLGAGTIIQQQDKVKGLTTAATIWCSAASGCLSALGMYAELLFITAIVVVFNFIFGIIDKKIGPKN
ncbi:MgtC/SapB family protein [Robertkochia aurantiaca]|uniref:MgtC/SapB family protein n=1 Tax=Robertkochia aurantiaca TaxID=2873700 RepID=UPI001CCB852A|nr:MgtC/SapB family protein [Robertkochia sp. 3YJGBD-33]